MFEPSAFEDDAQDDFRQDTLHEPQQTLWHRRLLHLRRHIRSLLLFGGGMLAALVALTLYNLLNPAPAPLTLREVNDTVVAGHGFGHPASGLLCPCLSGDPAGHRAGPGP